MATPAPILDLRPVARTLAFLRGELQLHQFKLRGQLKRRRQLEREEEGSRQTIKSLRGRINRELDLLRSATKTDRHESL